MIVMATKFASYCQQFFLFILVTMKSGLCFWTEYTFSLKLQKKTGPMSPSPIIADERTYYRSFMCNDARLREKIWKAVEMEANFHLHVMIVQARIRYPMGLADSMYRCTGSVYFSNQLRRTVDKIQFLLTKKVKLTRKMKYFRILLISCLGLSQRLYLEWYFSGSFPIAPASTVPANAFTS